MMIYIYIYMEVSWVTGVPLLSISVEMGFSMNFLGCHNWWKPHQSEPSKHTLRVRCVSQLCRWRVAEWLYMIVSFAMCKVWDWTKWTLFHSYVCLLEGKSIEQIPMPWRLSNIAAFQSIYHPVVEHRTGKSTILFDVFPSYKNVYL